MTLRQQLTDDMKGALRSREQCKLDTLRMVLSAVKNQEIDKKADLSDEAVSAVIATLVKQRKEAAQLYRKGGREDLAEKEEEEILVLKAYLPEEMNEEELEGIVKAVISETGASSMAEMGKVMKAVMARVSGRADGNLVSSFVKKSLA